MRHYLLVLFLLGLSPLSATAGTISIGGVITQSTPDGTGPAVNNPSLNNVTDLQKFTIDLNSATAITGPGFYNLTGSSLIFSVPAASAGESSFGKISLTITAAGVFDDFSLFACIAGADCSVGNAFSASFRIPAAGFYSLNVAATGLDQPHPFELLEDDGITDLHGSITTYSNTTPGMPPVTVTPEPSSGSLAALSLLGFAVSTLKRNVRSHISHISRRSS